MLSEENATGRINSANYDKLFQRYQCEQVQLEAKIAELEKEITRLDATCDNSRKFVELVAKYTDLQELDAPIVNELCEKILLHQARKEGGKRIQEVEIFYRFVGKIPEH
jgi:cell division protein FtsB